jgi:hypothetical protein
MIESFDETLREIVRREVANGGGVEVAFDAPTREWADRRNAPVVNLYLYDIRDDLTRRETQYQEVRDATGRVLSRQAPVRRFRLSYLVTAWTQRPEDEHRLLSACIATFMRHETLGPSELAGALSEQPHHVELEVAYPPTEDRSIADVWTALGGELKPSLDLVAIVPFVVERGAAAGPPVLETPRISVAVSEPDALAAAGAGAAGRRAARRAPASAGEASAGEASAGEASSGEGRTVAEGAEPDLPRESIRSGAESQPGRVIHIRTMKRP